MYLSGNGLLFWSVVSDCDIGVCGDCNDVSAGIWVIHTGAKSGGKLVTPFDSDCYNGVSAGIWVKHTGAKSGASKLVKVKEFF